MRLPNSQRCPLQTERGAQTLKNLIEDPHAPKWNYQCGDMLSRADLEKVRQFESDLQTPATWKRGEIPLWLSEFSRFCEREVPFYRAHKADRSSSTRSDDLHSDFFALPTTSRRDLARAPWSFVPDSQPLSEMVMYSTSGTTSEPLPILSHPRTTSLYLPLLQQALRLNGIENAFANEPNRVAIALLCAQKKTLTYASVSSVLDNAGFVKINLHPDDWNAPDDVLEFLKSCDPQALTGDPLSFSALMKLESSTRSVVKPRALISSATTLAPALKTQLETHFGCAVIDLYSTNESGIIASSTRSDGIFEILPPDLYVETLRADGTVCDENEIGEIVISGGRNPFLPLLRYRTGDFARLIYEANGRRVLRDFSGRKCVRFRDARGETLTSIDVANALRPFALTVFAFHQNQNGDAILTLRDHENDENAVRIALQTLFGARNVEIVGDENLEKTLYSSDLDS